MASLRRPRIRRLSAPHWLTANHCLNTPPCLTPHNAAGPKTNSPFVLFRISRGTAIYIRRPGQLPIGQTAKARSGYRVQSLRKGHDRRCRTHPIHVAPLSTDQNRTSARHRRQHEERHDVPTPRIAILRLMAPLRRPRIRRLTALSVLFSLFPWFLGPCLLQWFNVLRLPSAPLLGSCVGKKWDSRYKDKSASSYGGSIMETILIVLLVLFLLGGGGWGYSRWRG